MTKRAWYAVGWLMGLGLSVASGVHGAGTTKAGQPTTVMAQSKATKDLVHVLKKGENIWTLSHAYLSQPSRWRELQHYNGVRKDRALPAGTPVRIPIQWLKQVDLLVDVLSVTGQAQWTRRGVAPMQKLVAGMQLKNGDQLVTLAQSFVTLRVPDGSIVQVAHSSALAIRAVQYLGTAVTEVSFVLDRGRVETLVVPVRNPDSVYEIRTPVAQLGVRGTRFRVSASDDRQSSRAEVETGQVAASNPTLATPGVVNLDAGFGTLVRAGEPPLPPVALLPAADLSALRGYELGTDFEHSFDAVPGAVAYYLQLARDPDFQQIVTERVLRTPSYRFSMLPEGRYHLRVRAVDAMSLEGLESRVAFGVRDIQL